MDHALKNVYYTIKESKPLAHLTIKKFSKTKQKNELEIAIYHHFSKTNGKNILQISKSCGGTFQNQCTCNGMDLAKPYYL